MTHPSRPVAVITGASSGIGEQFARRYAREGYDLVLVARSGAVLEALAAELARAHRVAVEVHPADLTREADVTALAEALVGGLPRVDHVVNCAGVAPEGDLHRAEEQALRQLVDLNVTALTLLTRAAVVRMRAQGHGTIVNIASAAGYQPVPHLAAYAASKSYVRMFTEALSEENRSAGLRILAVSPGDTLTPMNPGASGRKRTPEQVVDTAWRGLAGSAPSLVDGRANSLLAAAASRVLPTRLALRTAERMMRHKG
ncbi:SDR family NAD(P)-dependent oxidoreductase [Microlunatus capsulatus]|uniref:Short-subunit dehydrogenase n=1 Tax=Microlunatus capsulatus TaxID=99117 RepID=A0ABS4Z780_9ACTN|nr:SDR family NAD(P)-dependent oxidoreductase [Microlunatus capsulatus]MBP2416113.1 short-subunit dehydrogenase [Microlunatus capsulatus]